MQERLQKILAQAGVCSRRAAEEYITAGRVTVNGRKAKLGDKADAVHTRICVDGKVVQKAQGKMYLMLHKPRGFVTTLKDEKGRRDVSTLVADCGVRVYPVGRLDYDSEGLLLMTNDGDLAYKLTHPAHEIPKRYLVRIRGNVGRIDALAQPMEIDGYQIHPAQIQIIRQEEQMATIYMTIHEGRNRQIRKMCEKCGFEVRRLKRESVGSLELDAKLPVGKWRPLTPNELTALQQITDKPDSEK